MSYRFRIALCECMLEHILDRHDVNSLMCVEPHFGHMHVRGWLPGHDVLHIHSFLATITHHDLVKVPTNLGVIPYLRTRATKT